MISVQVVTLLQQEKQVKLQFVLCVHYKNSTWGHGSDSRHVGPGAAVVGGGGAAVNTWLLSQTHHMLPFPFHTSTGSSRNTGSLLIRQMALGAMGPHKPTYVLPRPRGSHVPNILLFRSLRSNGHTAGRPARPAEKCLVNKTGLRLLTSAVWFHSDFSVTACEYCHT